MAIFVKTNDANALLAKVYKAIDEKKIITWEYDQDRDFTHSPDQWRKKAWLRPSVLGGELRFALYGIKEKKMSKTIYGVFHGRFIEELLTHFDTDFSSAIATASKADIDRFE